MSCARCFQGEHLIKCALCDIVLCLICYMEIVEIYPWMYMGFQCEICWSCAERERVMTIHTVGIYVYFLYVYFYMYTFSYD